MGPFLGVVLVNESDEICFASDAEDFFARMKMFNSRTQKVVLFAGYGRTQLSEVLNHCGVFCWSFEPNGRYEQLLAVEQTMARQPLLVEIASRLSRQHVIVFVNEEGTRGFRAHFPFAECFVC